MIRVAKAADYVGTFSGIVVNDLRRCDIFPVFSAICCAQNKFIFAAGNSSDSPANTAINHGDLKNIHRNHGTWN